MKRSKLSREKYLRRKGAAESGVELSPVFKIIRSGNGIKRVVTSGQDPTHLHFQLVKRNKRKA